MAGGCADLEKITDSVYTFTYNVLDEYCSEGLVPRSCPSETKSVWHVLLPNILSPIFLPTMLNEAQYCIMRLTGCQGYFCKIRGEYKSLFSHDGAIPDQVVAGDPHALWPDFDMIGISLYHGWNKDDYAGFNSLEITWISL